MIDDYRQENDSSNNGEDEVTLPQDQAYQEILSEIDKQQSRQKSWVKNILILVVSLLIFFQLGLFRGGLHGAVAGTVLLDAQLLFQNGITFLSHHTQGKFGIGNHLVRPQSWIEPEI